MPNLSSWNSSLARRFSGAGTYDCAHVATRLKKRSAQIVVYFLMSMFIYLVCDSSLYNPSRESCLSRFATPRATMAVTVAVCSWYSGMFFV